MGPKRERETNARSKIIPGENQEASTDRARLNCNMLGRGLLRAHARPERITSLIWHSSAPSRSLSLILAIRQRLATFLFVKKPNRLFSSGFRQNETAQKGTEETVNAAFHRAARPLRSGWFASADYDVRSIHFTPDQKPSVTSGS